MPQSVPLVQRLPRGRVRSLARSAALDTLGVAGRVTGRTARGVARNRVQFLYLHGIEPGREDAFRTFVTGLQREHTFLSHSEAVDRVRTGTIDRPYLSISFDDGFLSCRTSARILADAGISGCYFVCSGLIGADRATIRRVFPAGSGEETGTMDWDDLEQLRADGHEIGSHTVHHPVLADVGPDQLVDEIGRSREQLSARLGPVQHFAWPRGQFRHFSPAAAKAVRDAGYTSCASAVRGAHVATEPDPFPCLRREHLVMTWPARHLRYFVARGALRAAPTDNDWPAGWDVAA